MDFEIIGNIEAIETIASARDPCSAYLKKFTGADDGVSLKALPASESQMVRSAAWNFIGMKHMESVEKT
jgi:hypothetical protein